jgi:hypothetical protein
MTAYYVQEIVDHALLYQEEWRGVNRPSRPINYRVDTLYQRLVWSWLVLTGKYDAIYWGDDT